MDCAAAEDISRSATQTTQSIELRNKSQMQQQEGERLDVCQGEQQCTAVG